MNLKSWLDAERGRATSLARHLDVSPGRITQLADTYVPAKFIKPVVEFTEGVVTEAELVALLLAHASRGAASEREAA